MITNESNESRECEKEFLKLFANQIFLLKNDDYSVYAQSCNESTWIKTIRQQEVTLNSHWIVFYNSFLSRRYNVHINVKIYTFVKIIKYIIKYVFKRFDMIMMKFTKRNDEIKRYLNNRYISSLKSVWRLMKFLAHKISSFVQWLFVHLSNEQIVMFDENASAKMIVKWMKNSRRMLMIYLTYN